MITQRNVANLIIAKTSAKTLTHSTNVDTAIAGMNNGEPVVVSPGGVIVNAAGTLPKEFRIAVKLSDGTLSYSDLIKARNIKSITATRATAASQQTDFVGYNGVAGSIEAINSNFYNLRLYMIPSDTAGFAQQKVKTIVYEASAAASQLEIARGLVKGIITTLSHEPETTKYGVKNIGVERVYSGAQLDAIAALTLTVSKDSNACIFSGDATAIVTVGSILRMGTSGAGSAPCYVVTAVSGVGAAAIYTLDIPWQGASATVAAASVETCAVGGDWGIKLTGVTFKFDAPKFNYLLPRWKTTLQDFGATTFTQSSAAAEGDGTYEEIASLEQFLQGNEGNFYRAQVPAPTFRTEVSSAATYGMIVIEFEDVLNATLGNTENSYKQLYIACSKPATGTVFTDANTGLCVTLQAYLTAYTSINSNVASLATEIAA